MALIGHVTPEMTLRYAKLATRPSATPTRRRWTRSRWATAATDRRRRRRRSRQGHLGHAEMLKPTRARLLRRPKAAGPCPYANICERCTSSSRPAAVTTVGAQLDDIRALQADAEARGWMTKPPDAARHRDLSNTFNAYAATAQPICPLDPGHEGRLMRQR